MARPLRIAYPNACYHIVNRGNRREEVFSSSADYELFLEKLVEFAELYDVVIYTYCLMPNHFHLQLRTRHPNISKFMQSFLTSFTLSVNRRQFRSGHLFQGRFKACLVENKLYKNKLSRYIHLNPVKTKALDELPASALKEYLSNFKWSSYRAYVGLDKKPKWLDRRFVLSSWGGTAVEKMRNYGDYVERGIRTDNADDIQSTGIGVMGSKTFNDDIIEKYLAHNVSDLDSREQPVLASVNAFSIDDVFEAVAEYYGVADIEKITLRRGCHSDARKAAMYLAGRHCRRRETLTSLAARFGVKISGLNMAGDKFKNLMRSSRSIREDIDGIEKIMNNKNSKMEV